MASGFDLWPLGSSCFPDLSFPRGSQRQQLQQPIPYRESCSASGYAAGFAIIVRALSELLSLLSGLREVV